MIDNLFIHYFFPSGCSILVDNRTVAATLGEMAALVMESLFGSEF